MAGKGGVWVLYYLQGEDGDSVETPNAFNIAGAMNEVRLGQFVQAFPLWRHGGEYLFRFRTPDKLSGYSWMDVSDPSAVLPRYENVICAKVLRLDRLPKPRSSRLRRKAPYGGGKAAAAAVGGDQRAAVGGTSSWRAEEAHRRPSQPQQHWASQARPRSASPATTHGKQVHHDDVNQGKSVTPPPSHGGSGKPATSVGSRGAPPPPPPRPAPPPQATPPPENLEDFLFSDSPTGSPRSSPRATAGGSQTRQRSGSGGGGGGGGGGGRGAEAEGKSGEDLLNFGHDSGAPGGRPKHAPEPPPRPPTTGGGGGRGGGGRSPVPAGWGNRPSGNRPGGASPGRKSTAGRMQGAGGHTNGYGGASGGDPASNNGRSSSGAGGGGGGGAGGGANASSLNRPRSFSGKAAASASTGSGAGGGGGGGPELMNFNTPGGGGGGGGGAGGGVQSAHVKNKKQEREQELKANVEKALEFKKSIDEAATRDQEALDAAKVKLGANLTNWAEEHGKKKSIRKLLCTMHTVLWEGNRWKPVSVADLIQPAKVKLAYRKAMLLVHPDKCGSLGPEERLIAKRVFEAVNEAYTVFQEKEMS